jgi:teichuronic acid biosynthesis glycosyltransferase TuaC
MCLDSNHGGVKLLTFTTLYPNNVQPRHGIFIETRLRQLVANGAARAVVLAPVPWFPSDRPLFRSWATYARVAREEERHGLRVLHPRYPVIPWIGMNAAPFLLAWPTLRAARRLIADGYDFDMIDAHYLYPDGVAAAIVGQRLSKPVVISARGSDVNLLPRYHVPRKLIQWAARRAQHVLAVSQALRNRLVELGVEQEKISVLRNGVNTQLFLPLPRARLRKRLGLGGQVLLSVGNLVSVKGHDLAVAALPYLPDATLVIVGDGPERGSLQTLADRLGVRGRLRLLPPMPQETLREYYNAADVLILASQNEGWPNVLLEAMACGTPVVASRVGGVPEVVGAPEAGRLLTDRTPRKLADSVHDLLVAYPDRNATRRYAQQFGWEEVSESQMRLYRQVIGRHRAASSQPRA